MKKWLMMALCLMLALNGAGALAEQQAVTIDNNDRTTTYEAAPERVVALSYSNAELLAALGLEDKVVAIFPGMYVLDDVSAEYRETVAGIPAHLGRCSFRERPACIYYINRHNQVYNTEPRYSRLRRSRS